MSTRSSIDPVHLEDLQKSGLSLDTITKAGIRSMPLRDIPKSLGMNPANLVSAYAIPYGINGNGNDHVRLRAFYDGKRKRQPRYIQRHGSNNHIYIPYLLDQTSLNDPAKSLVITEGEKKALKACQDGLTCVGLGGLWNWKKNGKPIADLDLITWANREVSIVPDNDWQKPNRYGKSKNLKKAVRELATELEGRGAKVKVVQLPESEHKIGLDDYLLTHSPQDFLSLPTLDPKHTDEMLEKIEMLNEMHAVVLMGGRTLVLNEIIDPVFNRPDISFSSFSDFKNLYLPEKVSIATEGGSKLVQIANVWLQSPYRRNYAGIVFSPEQNVPGYYNLYRGLAVKPKKGDWTLIQRHIKEIICNNDGDIYVWVLAWIADLFQNPGNEMAGTCIVLRGKRGTGKGCFVNPLAKIVGNHALHIIHQNQLTGRFNNHLKDAVLVFADECFWAGDKTSEGVLKGIITNPTFTVEPKGKDCFSVKNHVHLIVASNDDWVVPAGLEERRFLVLDVADTRIQDTAYFGPIFKQIESGGAEAMLHDLLQMDISSINLRHAPKTDALMDQIENSMDTATRFWFDRLTDGTLRRNHGRWQEHVLTDDFYDDYITISNQTGRRHCLAKNAFVKKLRNLCPGIFSKQVTGGSVGERPRALFFPPLDDCRNLFQAKVGMNIKWDADDESLF